MQVKSLLVDEIEGMRIYESGTLDVEDIDYCCTLVDGQTGQTFDFYGESAYTSAMRELIEILVGRIHG